MLSTVYTTRYSVQYRVGRGAQLSSVSASDGRLHGHRARPPGAPPFRPVPFCPPLSIVLQCSILEYMYCSVEYSGSRTCKCLRVFSRIYWCLYLDSTCISIGYNSFACRLCRETWLCLWCTRTRRAASCPPSASWSPSYCLFFFRSSLLSFQFSFHFPYEKQ